MFRANKKGLGEGLYLNPKKWPTANIRYYFSATECLIDLKPSCILKFVRCLDVYGKKIINLDRGGTLEGLLSAMVPKN